MSTKRKERRGGLDSDLIPYGWQAETWAKRLRYLADACRELHPETAERYEAMAGEVETATRLDNH